MPDQSTSRYVCTIDNCDRPRRRKDRYCGMHRGRLERHGSFETVRPLVTPGKLDGEEWRPVVGYESWYSVSNLGRVRRDRDYKRPGGALLRGSLESTGYKKVMLCDETTRRTIRIHTLVANAFLPARPGGKWISVNHVDGVKANNRASNLEWATQSRQVKHAWDIGLRRRA